MIKVMTYLDLNPEFRAEAAQKKLDILGPRLADRTMTAEQRQLVQEEIQTTNAWVRGSIPVHHSVEVSEALNSQEAAS